MQLKRRGYRVHPSKSVTSRSTCRELFGEILQMIGKRFELAREFIEKDNVGFVHLTIFYINVLQHFLWDDDLVRKAWKVIDEELGYLMSLVEEGEWTLMIFSDHGSNRIEEVFNINAWLRGEGLLRMKHAALPEAMHRMGITREREL